MSSCCPQGAHRGPPYPGYAWNDKGTVDQVGDMAVYRVGTSTRCVIWCHDIYGFEGGRTRELCDKLSEAGYLVLLPDFFRGDWRDVEDPDLVDWIASQTDWYGQRQVEWVEQLLPYAKSLGALAFAAVGNCWGGYMVMRLSSYGEFKAGVSLHPAITVVAKHILKEDIYELFDEVQCPQLMITAGEDDDNEKLGGLANKVWGVMKFGDKCEFREYPDMRHGWTVRGDMRDAAVNGACRAAFNALLGFLGTHMR